MSLSTTARRIQYTLASTNQALSFPYYFFANSDLVVVKTDPTTFADTTLVITTNYTVTGAGVGAGGTVTMVGATVGDIITIYGGMSQTQPVALTYQGQLPSASLEQAYDRATMLLQQLRNELDRTIRIPVSNAALSALARADRASTVLTFDADGVPALVAIDGAGTGASNHLVIATGSDTARTLGRRFADGLNVADFGAVGDNATDDYANIQEAIDYVSAAGGGTLRCQPGKTYKLTTGPIVKDDVSLDLQGATLRLVLVGTGGYDYGVRLRSRAGIINGTVTVESSGTVGSQVGIHSPVNVGPLYGDGGTVASPSADEGVTGWFIRDMVLSTDRAGKVGIQVVGGANRGVIENVSFPDSATMGGAIHFDWGYVGTFSTATSAGILAGRIVFDAGTMYTTHPNNISIRNIAIGAFTRGVAEASPTESNAAHGLRFSGCYNISVDGVTIEEMTFVALRYTAGDPGFEFAPASVKPMANTGLIFRNVAILQANNGWGVITDSFADNIQRAIDEEAYVPLLPTITETDMIVSNVRTVGNASANASDGFLIRYQDGGLYEDCQASGHLRGVVVGQRGNHIHVNRGFYFDNLEDDVFISDATNPPEDTTVSGVRVAGACVDATATSSAGIRTDYAVRPNIRDCVAGYDGVAGYGLTETTMITGIRTENNTTDAIVEDNHVYAVKAGGSAYTMGSSTDYAILRQFNANNVASAVVTKYSGANIVPYDSVLTPSGTRIRRSVAAKASLTGDITPSAGVWVVGDTIEYSDPVSGGYKGTVCTAAGSPGTWKAYGAIT